MEAYVGWLYAEKTSYSLGQRDTKLYHSSTTGLLKVLPTNKEIRTAGRSPISWSHHAGAVGSAHGNCQDGVGVAHAQSLEGKARFSASHTRRIRVTESKVSNQ